MLLTSAYKPPVWGFCWAHRGLFPHGEATGSQFLNDFTIPNKMALAEILLKIGAHDCSVVPSLYSRWLTSLIDWQNTAKFPATPLTSRNCFFTSIWFLHFNDGTGSFAFNENTSLSLLRTSLVSSSRGFTVLPSVNLAVAYFRLHSALHMVSHRL